MIINVDILVELTELLVTVGWLKLKAIKSLQLAIPQIQISYQLV
jgi:hypothetical protein